MYNGKTFYQVILSHLELNQRFRTLMHDITDIIK